MDAKATSFREQLVPQASAGASITARLDRLPIGRFHWRLLGLIGAGMFFDSFDIYLAGSVLGVLARSGFSTLAQNAQFVSAGQLGMVIGSFAAGWLGDRFGRRFTYQFNLAIFGLGSIAAAFAPNMTWLIALRFVCGIGMGAEIAHRLWNHGRVRAALASGPVGGLAFPDHQFRLVCRDLGVLAGDPVLRLAPGVRHRRDRRAGRLVDAQGHARIAPLAGKQGARRGGGGRSSPWWKRNMRICRRLRHAWWRP